MRRGPLPFTQTLVGPSSSSSSILCSSTHTTTTHLLRVEGQPTELTQLTEQLKSFESVGVHEEERTLYDEFVSDVAFENGRYKVSLPWKEFHEPLADNYLLSVKGLLNG